MRRFHRGYLTVALALAAGGMLFSVLVYPEWGQSRWWLIVLAVAVAYGVVEFLANLRAILTPPSLQEPPASNPHIDADDLRAGRDIHLRVGGIYHGPAPTTLTHFDAITDRGMQAKDWKHLHQQCQAINLKLVVLHGVLLFDNVDMALHDLENHWRMECSGLIVQFVRLDGLPDRQVRQELTSSDHGRRWLANLQQMVEQLDIIIDQCDEAGKLNTYQRQIRALLSSLERTTSELLSFLDLRLQKTLTEMDQEIEAARASFASL